MGGTAMTAVRPSIRGGRTMKSASALPLAYVLTGEAIYTMDSARPRVEAVGVFGDRIVATGGVGEVAAALPAGARRIELGSRMLLPGFTDSHIHFGYVARKWQAVDLDGCTTVDAALQRVQAYAEANPDVAWIDGHGWDANKWSDSAAATRFALDQIVPDLPVALSSKDGHALWVNSATLAVAGIDRGTPDPEGGLIARDDAGAPTGILVETARNIVFDALPAPDPATLAATIEGAIPQLHAQGITAIHCPELIADWQAYERLQAAGRLGVRVTYLPPIALLDEAIALGLSTNFGNEWLRFGPMKIFADGTLGSRTAAMLEPFVGEPNNVGLTVYDKAELTELVCKAASHGMAVAVHAIGDRAVRDVLDAVEAARAAHPNGRSLRHRIEHVQILHPDDVGRMAELDVVASMQPLHCPADRVNAERYWGPGRTRHAFAFRSLSKAGATLAFGSDAPFGLDLSVDSFSILRGVHAAQYRCWPGTADPAWHPEQGLTVDEALLAFTLGPAFVGGEEAWRGSLTPGKVADMVVLDEDLTQVDPDGIVDVPVLATVVGGRLVHGEDTDLFKDVSTPDHHEV